MFKVSYTLLILVLLTLTEYMDSASLRFMNFDEDQEWEKLFGHLSENNFSTTRGSDVMDNIVERDNIEIDPTAKPTIPPMPPAEPFVFDPANKDKLPSVGANTHGSMEGIAISQNRGTSLGIYMVHSSYNNFHTIFGNSNYTKPRF